MIIRNLQYSSFPRRRESTASRTLHVCSRGFTMIELTTVALIILMLIGIALPNFLEAQIRVRVTAAQSNATLLSQCLEEYYIANRVYPPNVVEKLPEGGLAGDGNPDLRGSSLIPLTTPVVYVSDLPMDLFHPENEPSKAFDYVNFVDWIGGPVSRATLGGRGSAAYLVGSVGPDNKLNTVCTKRPPTSMFYNPTNGTKSSGDLLVFGP